MRAALLPALLLSAPAVAVAAPPSPSPSLPIRSARTVIEDAVAAAGGEGWLNPSTLILEGTADFYSPTAAGPVRHVDDYRMWRAMDPDRRQAHAADGKVRITARIAGKTLFEVGFDGATTWNEKGIVPRAEADKFWAENFGFGIIRQALKGDFRLERAPDRSIDGHRLEMVRVIDPAGAQTLFGIDARSHFIRYMGFATTRGWHERVYDDFAISARPRWVQAREVTLFYNGVRANTVHWARWQVGAAIPPAQFAPPPGLAGEPK